MFRILRYALGLAHTVIKSATIEDDRVVVDVRPHKRHGLRCPVCGRRCGQPWVQKWLAPHEDDGAKERGSALDTG